MSPLRHEPDLLFSDQAGTSCGTVAPFKCKRRSGTPERTREGRWRLCVCRWRIQLPSWQDDLNPKREGEQRSFKIVGYRTLLPAEKKGKGRLSFDLVWGRPEDSLPVLVAPPPAYSTSL